MQSSVQVFDASCVFLADEISLHPEYADMAESAGILELLFEKLRADMSITLVIGDIFCLLSLLVWQSPPRARRAMDLGAAVLIGAAIRMHAVDCEYLALCACTLETLAKTLG
jgi:hypothetical protein